jgi:site-specific DNA recombinase
VQGRLAGDAVTCRTGGRIKSSSLLTGLIFDGDGNRMTPTHAVKNGNRYHYYVSRPLITGGKDAGQRGLRIPAADIEQIVTDRICRLLSEPASVLEMIENAIADPAGQHRFIAAAGELAHSWSKLSPLRVRVILLTLVQRIEVRSDGVGARLLPGRLAAVLDNRPGPRDTTTDGSAETPVKTILIPGELCRAGKEVRMMLDPAGPTAPQQTPDPVLVRAILKAHRFNDRLVQGGLRAFGDLARGEKLHRFYLILLRLAYLAPDITAAILDGRQPARLTATRLIEHPSLPLS